MTTSPDQFYVSAIPADTLDRIRAAGKDDLDNHLEVMVDEEGGSPLRCCLQPAEPGDRIALIAYRPFQRPGPYAEVGPVFIHADHCAGYTEPSQYPARFRGRPPMVFRPYDFGSRIVYSSIAIVDGQHAERAIDEIFRNSAVELIHVRNVHAGCYMFAIHRRPDIDNVTEDRT